MFILLVIEFRNILSKWKNQDLKMSETFFSAIISNLIFFQYEQIILFWSPHMVFAVPFNKSRLPILDLLCYFYCHKGFLAVGLIGSERRICWPPETKWLQVVEVDIFSQHAEHDTIWGNCRARCRITGAE